MFSCAVGREEHCKHVSLACVGYAHSVWTTLGLPQLMASVDLLPRSTVLRLQVALQGNCPKQGLGFVHFPGLSCSGSCSQVLHKAQTWFGLCFLPFLGPSNSGDQVLGECTVPDVLCVLITSLVPATRFPWCTTRVPSQVCHVSPWGADL